MPGPDDERIEIDVVLNDMTSPSAENVDRKLENIDKSGKQTSGTLEDLGTTVDENGKKWRRFGGILRRSKKDIDDVGKSSEGTRKKVKGLGDESVKAEKKVASSTRGMKRSFSSLFKWLRRIRSIAMFGIKWGVIADGVGFLGTALKGLGAAGYAAVAGLSPLVGLLGAMPGLYATLGQSIGVVKLATAGLGDAIGVMANPKATVEEYRKATKDLHAEQIRFAQSVATSIPLWKELRKEVGGRFFKNVGPMYMQLTKRYQPLLNKQLGETADIWNDIIERSFEYLDSQKGYETFGDVLEGNNKVMENGSGILTNSLRGLLVFLRASSPMLQTMASDFDRWTGRGANWLEKNEGRVTRFLNNSWELAKDVGNVVGDIWMGLYNIGKYSDSLSGMMGKDVQDIASDFRTWTESKKGRREIKEFFREMRPVVRELGRWVRDLSIGLNDITLDNNDFLKLSKGLRREGIPAIVDLVQAFQGYALPMLVEGAEIYGNLKEAGVTGGVGRAFNVFIDGLGKVASMAADMPDSAKNLVAFATGLGAAYGVLNRFSGPSKLFNKLSGGRFGNSGIQKVWVMNPGFGGAPGSRPGAPTGGPGAKPGRHKAPTRLGRVAGGIRGSFRGLGLGSLAAITAGTTMMGSDNKTTKGLGQMLAAGGAGSAFGPWGAGIGAAAAGLRFGIADAQAGYAARREGFKSDPNFILNEYMTTLKKQQEGLAQGLAMSGGDKTKMMMSGGTGNPFFTSANLEASQKALREMDATFERLTGFSIPQYNSMLNDLPKDVQTKIQTPGAFESNKQIKDLLKRFDMTPKEKQTALKLLGADESLIKMRDLKAAIDALQDKVVRINVERTNTLIAGGAGGIGKGEDAFAPRFRGGATAAGKWYLTGEMGPEAWVSRSGAIKMLGLNGPELVKPGSGAVVNASKTSDPFGGNDGDSPAWAVAALQRAARSKGQPQEESASRGTWAVPVSVSVGPVYATSDVDVERAVKKALRDIETEREERGNR
jgi:hypothetical protein